MGMNEDEENEEASVDPAALIVPTVFAGDRCETQPGGRPALIKYIGPLTGAPRGSTASLGYWVGVQYDEKVGKNDGKIHGRRYFRCPPGHGGFLRASKVTKVEQEAEEPTPQPAPEVIGRRGSVMTATRLPLVEGGIGDDAPPSHVPPSSASVRPSESMATRIAHRRQERSFTYSARPNHSPGQWQRADSTPVVSQTGAVASQCKAGGPGLIRAVVGSLAQFMLTACNSEGASVGKGGDAFTVVIRGCATGEGSQPGVVRAKIIDRADGTYMVEYRPWLTGMFEVHVALSGHVIPSSPFTLSVVNLRPDPSKCVVRGDALHWAIARTPMKFEILFVDAMGHPTQAEDVDVFVRRTPYLIPYRRAFALPFLAVHLDFFVTARPHARPLLHTS